ncbi:MAG: pilus assembly PilX N-terminal domain-containing protein [Desulforhabdus sp.]|nr:pilus assembly PilX N-terminal domain-containing protein [Desulforhabdus sp.]
MKRSQPIRNDTGMALIITILVMAASTVVALSLSVQNVIETRIAANNKVTEMAFRNAEAGIEHARMKLAGLFASHPQNVARIRSNQQPSWDFLFPSAKLCDPSDQDDSSFDADCDPQWDERLIDLGSSDYKVFARDPEDLTRDGSVIDTDQVIIIRSVGFAPAGARQAVEVRIQANAAGAQFGYYAQEGGGPTKNNANIHDKSKVSGGMIDTGILR